MRTIFSIFLVAYLFLISRAFPIDNVLSQDVVKNFVTNSGFENGLAPHSTTTSGVMPYAIVTSSVRSGYKALHFVSGDVGTTTLSLVTDSLPVGDTYDLYFYYTASLSVAVDLKTYAGSYIESFLLAPCVTYCKSPVKTILGNQRYKFVISGITDIFVDDVRAEKSVGSVGAVSATYPLTASNTSGIVTIGVTTGDFPVSSLTANSKVKIGTNDAYSRGQIWNYLTDSILRLGSLGQDGDAVGDNSSEGLVIYGKDPVSASMTSAVGNFGYARIKPDRIGLYKSTANSAGYYFRADGSGLYLTNNAYVKTFDIDRLTGNITNNGGASQVLSNNASSILTGSGVYDYELASLSGILTNATKNRVFYVAIGGSDVDCSTIVKFNCGDGSINRPYASINHTISKIPTPNDQDHHYVISLGAGRFIETADILLPPYVDLIGQSHRATYVRVNSANSCIGAASSWATGSTWTTLKGFYAGGSTKLCFDLQAIGGSNANITLHDLWANSTNTFKGRNAGGGDYIEAYDTFFGLAGGVTTIDNFLPQWQQGLFAGPLVITNSLGSTSGNFVNSNFNANVTIGGPFSSTIQFSNSPFGSAGLTLTATGTTSFLSDAVSLPPLANQVLGPSVTFTCIGNISCNGGGSGGIVGTGTANKITKWSGTATVTNSSLSDDGTTLDISNVDVKMTIGKYFYLGDPSVDGCLRYSNNSGAMLIEKRISGIWTELMTIDEN